MTLAEASVNYDVFALSDLEGDQYTPLREAVADCLNQFECARSPHLERFAREKVQSWEDHGHSRTYVLVCPDGNDGIDVPAFFTIGMTGLDLSEVPKQLKKKLHGSITLNHTGAYTIAELARSDRYSSAQLPGATLLDEAHQIVRQSRQLIAGRFLVVDAQPKVFEHLYEPAGYKQIGLARPPQDMPDAEFITACVVIKGW